MAKSKNSKSITVINNVSVTISDPVKLLSPRLKRHLRHRAAFRRAFAEGKIIIDDGAIIPQFDTIVELAYFCGRCFNDDFSEKVFKRKVWQKGEGTFPEKEIEAFFDIENIGQTRRNRLNNTISDWSEAIDNLFVINSPRNNA